tara:strand:- start:1229 stop:1807 length:579 start_codon:yes stop_codon:yes gene_type:complete
MVKLFKTYFQKSKVFLYPLLGISKGTSFVPEETYMAWKDVYDVRDMKLFCLYHHESTEKYLKFERTKLLKHVDFYDYNKIGKDRHLYIFDLSNYPQTWLAVVSGLYSKTNEREKKRILDFFGEKGVIGETVESYLYPEYYHEDYAQHLNVGIDLIKNVWEVCDKPDLGKETLKEKGKQLSIIKNKSISLYKQ